MGKLINAKINLSKIDKSKIFEGKKGKYLDLTIWINDQPDQYGNDISIQQRTGADEPKIYLGEGKFFVKKEADPVTPPQSNNTFAKEGKVQVSSMSNINDLPGATEDDDLPY